MVVQAERKMQFSTHSAKLRAALEYETRRDTLKPISDAEATIEKHKAMLVELQQEEATISGALHEHGAAMAVLQEEVRSHSDRGRGCAPPNTDPTSPDVHHNPKAI